MMRMKSTSVQMPKPPKVDYLKYSGANLTDVKPVHSEYPKEPAQQESGEAALGTGARRPDLHAGRCTAVRTRRRQIGNDLPAARAKLLIGTEDRLRFRHRRPPGATSIEATTITKSSADRRRCRA